MITRSSPGSADIQLARQVREQFGRVVLKAMDDLGHVVASELDEALRGGKRFSLSEMTLYIEAAGAFKRLRDPWLEAMRQQWLRVQRQYDPQKRRIDDGFMGYAGVSGGLELVDDGVVESRIMTSRLAAAAGGHAADEWRDLRQRVRRLEQRDELGKNDPLRAEVLSQCVIQAWIDVGLKQPMWALVERAVQRVVGACLKSAWLEASQTLEQHGWSAEYNLRKSEPRGTDSAGPSTRDTGSHADATGSSMGSSLSASQGDPSNSQPTVWHGASQMAGQAGNMAGLDAGPMWRSAPSRRYGPQETARDLSGGERSWPDSVRPSALAQAAQETRLMTGMSPMMRVRQRAQGVWGQLRRMLVDQVDGFEAVAGQAPEPLSPALAHALNDTESAFAVTQLVGSSGYTVVQASADVGVVAGQLRQHATELKAKTEKPNEKAIIEVVALMFQAILAEERIAAGIRVWFARLQLPVLRLALAEPDFFASIEHPARQLIDRMGSCALGFEQAQITDKQLEPEIKRIVQVVEQYPETGRRVYELVLDEFKKFLGRSLIDSGTRKQAATLAQRVEQKEALAVQYTIELRRMLQALSVDSSVREFLFRVWSDVLAMAAVRYGPQDGETMRRKQVAADLIWAVSPKPERAERSQVVQKLPGLLHSLRDGMTTLAMAEDEQDSYVKGINDAVMHAFMLRDEGVSAERMRELSQSLAGLEDIVTDDPQGDMWLDPGMIELMFGEDSAVIEVIADGGSTPIESVVQWASHLDLGAWFSLEYADAVAHVQYAWRSERGQLHLFAAAGNEKNYLVQTQRLAAYLQAGLLVPAEDEALTVRATREALTQLQGHPEKLFH